MSWDNNIIQFLNEMKLMRIPIMLINTKKISKKSIVRRL